MKRYNIKRGNEGAASSSDGENDDDKDRPELPAKRRKVEDEVFDNGCNPIIIFCFDSLMKVI